MKLVYSFLISLVLTFSAFAISPVNTLKKEPQSFLSRNNPTVDDYQIGDEFGKTRVTRKSLENKSAPYIKAATSTAYFGGATSFYLGKFAGEHVMATNHHVLPNDFECWSGDASFTVLGKSYRCKKRYGSWSDIDLALFSIEVPAEDEFLLHPLAGSFAFHTKLYPGQELMTFGYGFFNNPKQNLTVNEDQDCLIFSGEDDFRFMGDPDVINPGPYQTWSVAIGCDISHGDSGSAIFDRDTGQILGLVWTAATSRPAFIRNSEHLSNLLRDASNPEIWNYLSYAVPAPKIYEYLSLVLEHSEDREFNMVLAAILDN